MQIFIPTYKRTNNQQTWDRLSPALRAKTLLVVHPSEVAAHQAAGRPVLACSAQGEGIAAVRDWILAYAHSKGMVKIVMIDDDCALQKRDHATEKIINMTHADQSTALKWLEDQLSVVSHCGWGVRALAWNAPLDKEYMENSRMMHVLAYNVPKVMASGARFTKDMGPGAFMTDFHMTLQLLELGYANRVSLDWKVSPLKSNAPGGCSEFRTVARKNESAEKLHALHPTVTKLRMKDTIWQGHTEATKDVTVQWKQAYRPPPAKPAVNAGASKPAPAKVATAAKAAPTKSK